MTGRAIRRYDMLVKVGAFGLTYAQTFPPGTLGDRMFAAIRLAARQLEAHATTQSSARSRAAADGKARARARLRARLRRISKAARGIAVDSPSHARRFRVPKTNGDHTLLTTARRFATDARPLEQSFVDHRLPPTFLADLEADIAAMEQASRDYAVLKQRGVAASAGVEAVLASAYRSLLRLDPIVLNVCCDDVGALARWKAARHVGRRRQTPASWADASHARVS